MKSLEQTIHEADLPAPAPAGEDFASYVSRVAHAAAFIGAAWAIANGPQVQGPQPLQSFGTATEEATVAWPEQAMDETAEDDPFTDEPGVPKDDA